MTTVLNFKAPTAPVAPSKAGLPLPEAGHRLFWEGDIANLPRTGTVLSLDGARMRLRWDGEPVGSAPHDFARDVIRAPRWRYARPGEMIKVVSDTDRPAEHPQLTDHGGPYNYVVGSRYSRDLTITDIAKAVRADIKAAIAANRLPKGLKVSVTSERYSMGQSLNVIVTAAPLMVRNPARVRWEAENRHGCVFDAPPEAQDLHSPEGKHILDTLKSIMDQYNYDRSESLTDYYDRNFNGHPSFAGRVHEAERVSILALPAHVTPRNRWTPAAE